MRWPFNYHIHIDSRSLNKFNHTYWNPYWWSLIEDTDEYEDDDDSIDS